MKRARHVNTLASEFVPQPLPGASAQPPLRAPRPALTRHPARWSWLPTNPGGWGIVFAFALFAAAVVGTAYLAIQEIGSRGVNGQMAPAAIDASAAHAGVGSGATAAPARTTGAADSASVESAAQPPESTAAAHGEEPRPLGESLQAAPAPANLAPRRPAPESRRKSAMRTNPPHSSEVSDESRARVAVPEAIRVAAPAPARETVVPDRWEAMSAALAACANESFLAGVMCTERVRYQYCEGYWGQVPQCRAAGRPGSSR